MLRVLCNILLYHSQPGLHPERLHPSICRTRARRRTNPRATDRGRPSRSRRRCRRRFRSYQRPRHSARRRPSTMWHSATLHVRCASISIRTIRPRHIDRAIGKHLLLQHAPEELQRRDRLVVGNLVASLVDAREGEVAVLPHFAVLNSVDNKGRVARGAEFVAVRIVHRERNGFAAEPLG